MNVLFVSVLWLAAANSSAVAAPAEAPAEPRQIAEAAMKYLATDDIAGMFKYIGRVGPIEKEKLDDALKTTRSQRTVVQNSYGKAIGIQFLSECRRGDSFARVMFAEKRTRMALRWEFIFYKPKDTWLLTHFFWDDTLKDVFQPC